MTYEVQISLSNKRINWIDWAKSICMFLVIFGHTHIQESESFLKQIIYTFHMPLFFFLSGMFCKEGFTIQNIIHDIKYILVPYYTYGVIGLLLPYPIDIKNIANYLLNVFMGNDISIGPIWFLPAIFICKQIGSCLLMLKRKHLITYFTFFIISFLQIYFLHSNHIPFFIGAAACGLPFYLLGHEFYNKRLFISRIELVIVTILFIFITAWLSPLHEFVSLAANDYGSNLPLYYLNAFTGILAIVSLCLLLEKVCIKLVVVSAYGSILTLWAHSVFLAFFNYYLPKIVNTDIGAYSLFKAIVYSTITYILCYFLIQVVDKYCPKPFGLRGKLQNMVLF